MRTTGLRDHHRQCHHHVQQNVTFTYQRDLHRAQEHHRLKKEKRDDMRTRHSTIHVEKHRFPI
jgi:hypothetical protein